MPFFMPAPPAINSLDQIPTRRHDQLQELADDDHTQYLNVLRHDTTLRHGATVVDHGSIGGLADDDHTQYLLVSGSRAMAGALNMGGFQINNVAAPTLASDAARLDTVTSRAGWTNARVAASGTATINAGTLVAITTITRNAGERFTAALFGANQANVTYQPLAGTGTIRGRFQETTLLNQISYIIINSDTVSRTVDWALIAFTP